MKEISYQDITHLFTYFSLSILRKKLSPLLLLPPTVFNRQCHFSFSAYVKKTIAHKNIKKL